MNMQQEVIINPVFQALTRPAMLFGVTLDYFALIAIGSLCGFILTQTLSCALIYIPLHCLGMMGCQYDPHIFRLLLKRLECPPVSNRFLWGVQTYAP